MPSTAVRAPLALGVKVTLTVHDAPAATLDAQVLVCAKSTAFVPVMRTPMMLKVLLPWLVSVMFWAGLVVPPSDCRSSS